MKEHDWDALLMRIRKGRCTPFLGAGACFGTLPLGRDVAERWSARHEYPLEDKRDLARVAQFLAVKQGGMFPKELIADEFDGLGPPDFSRPGEPHAVLAGLPLPIYMTTNYDDFMTAALRAQGKDAKREICRWNNHPNVQSESSALDAGYVPTPAAPVVYHLHGHFGVLESMVLSEDDYLAYLVAVARDDDLLPHEIQKALAGSSLLFVGYRLADWSFRVVHRGLVAGMDPSLRQLSVTVQLPSEPPAADEEAYLDEYFGKLDVRVYWGTAEKFMAELRERWEAHDGRDGRD